MNPHPLWNMGALGALADVEMAFVPGSPDQCIGRFWKRSNLGLRRPAWRTAHEVCFRSAPWKPLRSEKSKDLCEVPWPIMVKWLWRYLFGTLRPGWILNDASLILLHICPAKSHISFPLFPVSVLDARRSGPSFGMPLLLPLVPCWNQGPVQCR